ncbi:hypothetical protein NGM10_17220 (plasmid) [Halorussus salilacus]|uniref:hypothetical protein n=1 Tax=Halorussus salilacus TaxID=2953750 RepID=UPI0020A0C4FB|nr:hypothetical protein [Halorussus salilacus]USZ70069.1 hypothetical protein NGM10_17220 [Halorussus salilacus]
MSEKAVAALEYDFEDQLAPSDVSEETKENPYFTRVERENINCPEPDCNKKCQVTVLDGETVFFCRKGHKNPYNEDYHIYWKVDSLNAVEELITGFELDTELEQKGRLIGADLAGKSLLMVPGEFRDDIFQNIAGELRDNRNLCVIAFREDTKNSIKPLIDRFGGLSMVIAPPSLDRKISNFDSMVEIRDKIEEEYAFTRDDVPEDLVKKIHDNPQYVMGALADFEKIEASKEKREELEKICALTFSQLMDCPLNSLGMEDRGNRIPDGFGFIFDDENNNSPLLVLDSKSVSSSRRDYPKITEKDGPQYRKYLEIIIDICHARQIEGKAIVFISPEFKISKIEDFLDELERSKFDDYNVVFMNLEAVITLVLFRSSLASDRKVRLNRGRWHGLLYDLFMDPDFEREEQDYELERQQGLIMTPSLIQQHFSNNLIDQRNRERILETVEEELREFVPE